MAIRKIKATSEQWGLDFDFTLEFDTEKTTTWGKKTYTLDEVLKSSLEFFSRGPELIEDADGDLCKAYAMLIGPKIVLESMEWNLNGIIRHFDNEEGYLKLDGTNGVTLIRSDSFEIEDEFSTEDIS